MQNNSGWFPLLHKIIVLPKDAEIKKGQVYIPEEFTQRDDQIQVEGVVVALGPEVFSDKRNSVAPKLGDTIMFGKLAGSFFKGLDGVKYRMIQDLDLVAIKGGSSNE